MFELIVHIVFYIVFAYLAFGVCYNYFFAAAAKLRPRDKYNFYPAKMNKFVVLIPAYKEDRVIITVAREARELNYPADLFDVVVIADQLKPDTIETISSLGVTVVEVSFESSTKAKALNAALDSLPDAMYDYAAVLDADNIAENDFLLKLNSSANDGYRAIQAHRTAKNQNTNTALLDAASEEVGNNISRQGARVYGLPSTIIGSGFAVEYDLFKSIMHDIRDVAGEDREIEVRLLKQKIDIEFQNDNMVYDEKVQSWDNFAKQRTRWAAAHADFFRKYYLESWKEFFKNRNWGFLNKMTAQAILPKVPLLATLLMMCVVGLIIDTGLCVCAWFALLIIYIVSMIIALPKKFYSIDFIKSIMQLPIWLWAVVIGLFKIKGQKTKFIHTDHSFEDDANK